MINLERVAASQHTQLTTVSLVLRAALQTASGGASTVLLDAAPLLELCCSEVICYHGGKLQEDSKPTQDPPIAIERRHQHVLQLSCP